MSPTLLYVSDMCCIMLQTRVAVRCSHVWQSRVAVMMLTRQHVADLCCSHVADAAACCSPANVSVSIRSPINIRGGRRVSVSPPSLGSRRSPDFNGMAVLTAETDESDEESAVLLQVRIYLCTHIYMRVYTYVHVYVFVYIGVNSSDTRIGRGLCLTCGSHISRDV